MMALTGLFLPLPLSYSCDTSSTRSSSSLLYCRFEKNVYKRNKQQQNVLKKERKKEETQP